MRIDTVRFGVRTNKTIRKTGQKNGTSVEVEKALLKQINKQGARIHAYNEKIIKSSNNFEKINKNERKRKLKENVSENEEDEYFEQNDEEIYVQVITESKKRAAEESDNENEETKIDEEGQESEEEEFNSESNEPVKAILDQLAVLQK